MPRPGARRTATPTKARTSATWHQLWNTAGFNDKYSFPIEAGSPIGPGQRALALYVNQDETIGLTREYRAKANDGIALGDVSQLQVGSNSVRTKTGDKIRISWYSVGPSLALFDLYTQDDNLDGRQARQSTLQRNDHAHPPRLRNDRAGRERRLYDL